MILTHRATATSAVLACLMMGCASAPPEPPQLIEARLAVREAQANPTVQAQAPLELRRATDALAHANRLSTEGASVEEVASAGYLATQRSRIAQSVAHAKTNDLNIAGAEADRERARADAGAAETLRAQARARMAERSAAVAQTSARNANQQTEQMAEQNRQMQQALLALQARPTERGSVVTLHDVTFQTDQSRIQPAALPTLRKLAEFLQRYPNRRVLIEGHTDSSGSAEHNVGLSLRRAEAVDQSLTQLGVSSERLSTVGYGEDYPVTDNLNAGNRAQNRRVEIYVSDSEAPVKARR